MIPRTTERPNTIALQWDGKYEEGRAQGAILPGYLLDITTDETNPQQLPIGVIAHATAGKNSPVRIAIEDRLGNIANRLLGRTIETAYAQDDWVPFVLANSGDIFQVRVHQNANYHIGTQLGSAGDGSFASGATVALVEVLEEHDFAVEDPTNTHPLLRVQAL